MFKLRLLVDILPNCSPNGQGRLHPSAGLRPVRPRSLTFAKVRGKTCPFVDGSGG